MKLVFPPYHNYKKLNIFSKLSKLLKCFDNIITALAIIFLSILQKILAIMIWFPYFSFQSFLLVIEYNYLKFHAHIQYLFFFNTLPTHANPNGYNTINWRLEPLTFNYEFWSWMRWFLKNWIKTVLKHSLITHPHKITMALKKANI